MFLTSPLIDQAIALIDLGNVGFECNRDISTMIADALTIRSLD